MESLEMKSPVRLALLAAVCLPLAACHIPGFKSKPKAPTGQIVAVVGDEEITLRELNAAMPQMNTADPNARQAVQDRVLQSLVASRALAQAARKAGVEKSADYALALKRAQETQLIQALEKQLADSVPAPSADEVDQFVTNNPNLFREHKVFLVDQLRVQGELSPEVAKQLEPLQTLEQVIAVLQQNKYNFTRNANQLDSLALGPEGTATALKLGSTDLMLLPGQQALLVNKVLETKVAPINPQDSKKIAIQYLTAHHRQEAVQRGIMADLKASANQVAYNASYKPKAANPPAGK
jgi:EpsD family peptidyl-prolyl cis-trans isomerase